MIRNNEFLLRLMGTYGIIRRVYTYASQSAWGDLSDIIQITKTPKILRHEGENLILNQLRKRYFSDYIIDYKNSLPRKMQNNYGMILNQIHSRLTE